MFSRKESMPGARSGKSAHSGLSFIGPEVVISGDLATGAQLHVDGRIDGQVRCGTLCQGGTGVIAGDIIADEARIAGLVEGTVSAGTLIVEASGRITGDVTYETISIAAGAQIEGRLARLAALNGDTSMLIATPTKPERARGTDLFASGGKETLVVE